MLRRLLAVAFLPPLALGSEDTLAVRTDTTGISPSEDSGATWRIRRTGLYTNSVQSVAYAPVNPDIPFAAGTRSKNDKRNTAATPGLRLAPFCTPPAG